MSTEPHRALEVGKAAEHIVCADLILAGHRAFLADQGLPYDLVLDLGATFIRVQVKATAAPRSVPGRPGSWPSYMFHVRRAGKGGRRVIRAGEFDLLALVALDIRRVAYLALEGGIRQTIHLRAPGAPKSHGNRRRSNMDEYPLPGALMAAAGR